MRQVFVTCSSHIILSLMNETIEFLCDINQTQNRKAAKALLVLIPLLGVTYLLVIVTPPWGTAKIIFTYLQAALLSTQVSIFRTSSSLTSSPPFYYYVVIMSQHNENFLERTKVSFILFLLNLLMFINDDRHNDNRDFRWLSCTVS